MGLSMMIVGGLLAMIMRWQLAWPETAVPGLSSIPEPYMYRRHHPAANLQRAVHHARHDHDLLRGHADHGRRLRQFSHPADDRRARYGLSQTQHAVFLGGAVAGVIMLASFFVPGGPAAGGWTSYAPLSAKAQYTGVEWGQNLWIISLLISGASSMMGAINYITTIINMRAPGMSYFRMPLTVWSLFVTAILLLLALPVLTSALAMLLFDRMAGTSFFLPEGGGEPLLWQHMFWFFGHPEVYILILPAMGMASEMLSTFSRKPIFGYHAMVFSMIAIAFLSWIVWGHHMFQSGMNPVLGVSFTMTTMVIAVPSAIKTFNWLGTLWGGTIRFTVPMLNALGFVSKFLIGGLSGIFMASTPVDIFIHDTYYIVAHIHYVVAGIIFALFAAVYYWFPKMFGRMMNEPLGKIHFVLTYIFFNGAFFPMHFLGVGGHMRRIYNPTQYEFLQPMQDWNVFITVSAFILGASQIFFLINFFWSLFAGKKAESNPWQANTLEWTAPSPPPHGNFAVTPVVYRGPYEYSSPEVKEDWLPQNKQLPGAPPRAATKERPRIRNAEE